MENASKALIMAGAILIAILLISAGLIILNSTKGVTEQGGKAAKTLEAETFNSQFTKYCGDRVLGSKVKDLYSFVASYKSANSDANISIFPEASSITIIPNKYYSVEATYDKGYVTQITVLEYTEQK